MAFAVSPLVIRSTQRKSGASSTYQKWPEERPVDEADELSALHGSAFHAHDVDFLHGNHDGAQRANEQPQEPEICAGNRVDQLASPIGDRCEEHDHGDGWR